MLDGERIALWTWDARPFPAFPSMLEVWSDGPNHLNGHWLTGRLGAASADEVIRAIAADWGVQLAGVEPRLPLIHGLLVEGTQSAREAMRPVLEAAGLRVRDGAEGLDVFRPGPRAVLEVGREGLVDAEGALLTRRRPDPTGAVGRLTLSYFDRDRDYLTGTVTAQRSGESGLSGSDTAKIWFGRSAVSAPAGPSRTS